MHIEIKQHKPHEVAKLKEGYYHRRELKINNERVGHVDFEYRNSPFPFYYISYFLVSEKNLGKGYGTMLLETINTFLDSKGKAGILFDRIKTNNPARGMYERHGWSAIPENPHWYSYNLPAGLEKIRLDKALYEIKTSYNKIPLSN